MLNETEPLLVAKFEQILITDFCSKGFLFKHLRWVVNYFRGKLHHKYFSFKYTFTFWIRYYPFSAWAKLSKKLTFLTPWYAQVSVRIRR